MDWKKTVAEYYKAHPDEEYVKISVSNTVIVGSFARDDYKKIYIFYQVGNMLKMDKCCVDKLAEWDKNTFDLMFLKRLLRKIFHL